MFLAVYFGYCVEKRLEVERVARVDIVCLVGRYGNNLGERCWRIRLGRLW